jgi:hypothetical protein
MRGQGALDFGPSCLKPARRFRVPFQDHPALGAEQDALFSAGAVRPGVDNQAAQRASTGYLMVVRFKILQAAKPLDPLAWMLPKNPAILDICHNLASRPAFCQRGAAPSCQFLGLGVFRQNISDLSLRRVQASETYANRGKNAIF